MFTCYDVFGCDSDGIDGSKLMIYLPLEREWFSYTPDVYSVVRTTVQFILEEKWVIRVRKKWVIRVRKNG